MLELLPVKRQAQDSGTYWVRLHVYAVTRVTTHPCSEHVELLDHMCGSMGNVVHGRVVLCAVVTEVELACLPEVYELLL